MRARGTTPLGVAFLLLHEILCNAYGVETKLTIFFYRYLFPKGIKNELKRKKMSMGKIWMPILFFNTQQFCQLSKLRQLEHTGVLKIVNHLVLPHHLVGNVHGPSANVQCRQNVRF